MNIEFISTSPKPICEGCLSVNRTLTPVHDVEIERIFKLLLDPIPSYSGIDHHNLPTLLCWECTAIIKRTLRYKKQVQYAQSHLILYKLHQITNVPNLSKLTFHHNQPEKILCDPNESIFNDQKQPKIDLSLKRNDKHHNTTELAFVKVEEKDEDENNDYDGFYVMNNDSGVHDEDLVAILKTTTHNHEEIKTIKESSKSSEEFGESDDEPLKKKAETKDLKKKPRGKRKNKNETAEGKIKKQTREKPAGVVTHERVARRLRQLNVPRGQVEMCVLAWEEVEAERQKALQSAAYTRHEYRCERCAVGFNHRFKLENHMKKHDPARGDAECSACGIYCRDAHALSAHRRRHRVRWRCVVCGELSSRAAVAADHFARTHGADAPTHTCSVCGDTQPSLGKLRNHMKNHAERPKCDLCDKTFRDKSSLRTHLFIHKGEKEYACSVCNKQFLFKKAMQLHRLTHDAPAHLYCRQCDLTFKNKMTFYQHMKYNLKHIDPALLKYACETCGKKFTKAARLNEHNTAVHLKATPVKCTVPDCNFACSSRTVLRTHTRMLHRRARERRDHVCHVCGKAYKTKTSLEGHMRAHSGERPFACAHCSSTFAYEAALYNHNKLVHLKAKLKKSSEQLSDAVTTSRQGPPFAPGQDNFTPLIAVKAPNVFCNQPM